MEDVRESIDDLVQLIQTYKSKKMLSKVMVSSLFKRRQEEAEAVINMAITRLQVSEGDGGGGNGTVKGRRERRFPRMSRGRVGRNRNKNEGGRRKASIVGADLPLEAKDKVQG